MRHVQSLRTIWWGDSDRSRSADSERAGQPPALVGWPRALRTRTRSAAWTLAVASVEAGGKPFACVVVDHATGEVLVEAVNQVSQSGDCTAHAEITAIRRLAAAGRPDLSDCDLSITAHPCPTCLGTLHDAQPREVVDAASCEQEGADYEDGNRYMRPGTFYEEYTRPQDQRASPARQASVDDPHLPFRRWAEAQG